MGLQVGDQQGGVRRFEFRGTYHVGLHQRTARAILTHDTRERLSTITAPALVLYGAEDIICPPRHSHQLASLIPDAQLIGVPGQAHQPFQEGPEEFNRMVLEYWAER